MLLTRNDDWWQSVTEKKLNCHQHGNLLSKLAHYLLYIAYWKWLAILISKCFVDICLNFGDQLVTEKIIGQMNGRSSIRQDILGHWRSLRSLCQTLINGGKSKSKEQFFLSFYTNINYNSGIIWSEVTCYYKWPIINVSRV